ncbi:MAG: phosphatase PAP2 family protein [Chloroflexi bacterium]|nr:phosphatase PAP2 family protein [Chloroflexota bacterium]
MFRTKPQQPAAGPLWRGLFAGTRGGLLIGALLVAAIGLSISAHQYQRFPGDLPIAEWVQSLSIPLLGGFLDGVSFLGNSLPAAVMTTAVVVLLWVLRHRADAAYMALITAGSTPLNWFVKELVDRSRPVEILMKAPKDLSSNSFPSGHTVFASVFFGLLILYISDLDLGPRWVRRIFQVLLIGLILSMGTSRVYLGVHWPSDIIGGYTFGAIYLTLVMWHRGHIRASRLTSIGRSGEDSG